jgi:hypothetical protein
MVYPTTECVSAIQVVGVSDPDFWRSSTGYAIPVKYTCIFANTDVLNPSSGLLRHRVP